MRNTDESNKRMVSKEQVDSPSADEGISGGTMSGGGGSRLKKGPWTAVEDAILIDYVKNHGEGNWNAVQKNTGLLRCGKSCRLRWANHLKPDLKKVAFTPEEERTIIELHALMGNKWARMALHLPGRTDNEIKNFWNTRLKRHARAGLPVYPPDVRVSPGENQNQSTGDFNSSEQQLGGFLHGSDYGLPGSEYEDYKAKTVVPLYRSPFPDGSQSGGFVNPMLDSKLLQDLEVFPSLSLENFYNNPSQRIHPPTLGSSYPYDPDPINKAPVLHGGAIPGSHCPINGDYSAFTAFLGSVKPELPSLQYSGSQYPDTDFNNWLAASPLQTIKPQETVLTQSGSCSLRNSGLLEDMLPESLRRLPMTQSANKHSSYPEVMPSDMVDCMPGWDGYSDPTSPLGCSAASVFSESTPPISGGPLDEFQSVRGHSGPETVLSSAMNISSTNTMRREMDPRPDFSRPDALLGSVWFGANSQAAKEHNEMNDALARILGGSSGDCDQAPTGDGSYMWNNMPAACQMPDLP